MLRLLMGHKDSCKSKMDIILKKFKHALRLDLLPLHFKPAGVDFSGTVTLERCVFNTACYALQEWRMARQSGCQSERRRSSLHFG